MNISKEMLLKVIDVAVDKALVNNTNRIYNLTWTLQKQLYKSSITPDEYDDIMKTLTIIQVIIEGFEENLRKK